MARQLEAVLACGGVGQHRIDRPRYLAAIQREGDFVFAAALPHLGRVQAVDFDGHSGVQVSARTPKVVDLEYHAPYHSIGIHASVEEIGPRLSAVRAPSGARAL